MDDADEIATRGFDRDDNGQVESSDRYSPASILVVDDDAAVRRFLATALGQDGHRVVEADDGLAAIDMALHEAPDLILMDIGMPQINGRDACLMLKENRRTRGIPVLLLTGRADRDARLDALAAGANDFLAKPLDLPDLSLRVRNWLVYRRLLARVHRTTRRLKQSERSYEDLQHLLFSEACPLVRELCQELRDCRSEPDAGRRASRLDALVTIADRLRELLETQDPARSMLATSFPR